MGNRKPQHGQPFGRRASSPFVKGLSTDLLRKPKKTPGKGPAFTCNHVVPCTFLEQHIQRKRMGAERISTPVRLSQPPSLCDCETPCSSNEEHNWKDYSPPTQESGELKMNSEIENLFSEIEAKMLELYKAVLANQSEPAPKTPAFVQSPKAPYTSHTSSVSSSSRKLILTDKHKRQLLTIVYSQNPIGKFHELTVDSEQEGLMVKGRISPYLNKTAQLSARDPQVFSRAESDGSTSWVIRFRLSKMKTFS